ncbi:ABC transporter substrate-binding protein [Allomesorhizobium camelthorni]|uniref:ABC transporter substrate-binding protein n=1 Tax=Allomesorhizobium camelthorni TaxID=475069 RepID=A0A6G4W9A3_9HYPH|nr:ABC transporter substrate-binding protein [Mesorhizobium camelthorni]NGO50826.1 ABC transporter substrate-binding protein [Mesorhizobium camelthorni]
MKSDYNPMLSPNDASMVENAIRRGATRRELLGMLMAGGMTAAFGGSVIAGATRAYADTPKKGGRIRAAGYSSGTTDTLDPAKSSLSTDYVRCTSFYNGLTRLDETLAPQMELAESFDTDDAVTWTVKLRKGVTFHDGKTLTADDVIYSLNRHKDPAVGSKAKALADQIAEVKKVSDNEITIVLSGPNADLPVILGTFHFLIIKDGTTDFTTAVGTGAFTCKEFEPGVRSIAARNENYWKGEGPYLDEVEFFAIADENARVNALLSGDVDLIGSINPRSTQLVEGVGGFELMTTTAGNYTNLVMRVDMEPGKNPDFMMAMKYLFDREQIKSAVFRGYAEVANDQPIPPSNRFYASDIPQRPYDPDKAKFLLEKAGMIGANIPVIASPAAAQSVEMAVMLQQAAQQVGLNLDIQKVPADGYWSNYWLKAPVHFGNINPRPTADVLFSLLYKSDAAWNEAHWNNPRFDKILLEARGLTDDAKRKELYRELQLIAHEESGIGIPVFISNIDALSSRLKGLRPMPTGGMMGFSFSEYVWLDA